MLLYVSLLQDCYVKQNERNKMANTRINHKTSQTAVRYWYHSQLISEVTSYNTFQCQQVSLLFSIRCSDKSVAEHMNII